MKVKKFEETALKLGNKNRLKKVKFPRDRGVLRLSHPRVKNTGNANRDKLEKSKSLGKEARGCQSRHRVNKRLKIP